MARVRSRAEFILVEYSMRRIVQPTLHGLVRGTIYVDAANISDFANGELLGTILGIPLKRKSALADDIYQYYNDAATPVLLATNG